VGLAFDLMDIMLLEIVVLDVPQGVLIGPHLPFAAQFSIDKHSELERPGGANHLIHWQIYDIDEYVIRQDWLL
jgi:hypothetical protein